MSSGLQYQRPLKRTVPSCSRHMRSMRTRDSCDTMNCSRGLRGACRVIAGLPAAQSPQCHSPCRHDIYALQACNVQSADVSPYHTAAEPHFLPSFGCLVSMPMLSTTLAWIAQGGRVYIRYLTAVRHGAYIGRLLQQVPSISTNIDHNMAGISSLSGRE